MSRALAALQAIARYEAGRRPMCELAEVTSVFDGGDGADAQSVSLTLKDSGLPLGRVPVATGLTGLAALPRIGDLVVVLFPRGDLGSALVVAQVYSDQRRPPSFVRDEAALVWPGDTDDPDTKGVRVSVSADGSSRKLSVTLGGDLDASLTVSDGTIELVSGKVTFRLHHASDTDGTAELSAGATKVSLAQDGDLTLESKGTLTLKANKIALEGDTQVTINGQTVEIN